MSRSTIDAAGLLEMALKLQRCPLRSTATDSEYEAWLKAEFGSHPFRHVDFALKLSEQANKMMRVLK